MSPKLKYFVSILIAIPLLLPLTAFAGKRVDWSTFNPNLKGAASAGKSTECKDCHDDYIKSFEDTRHAKTYKAKFGREGAESCEVCHGPAGNHLKAKDKEKPDTIVSFKNISSKQKSRICLQCHEKGEQMHWRGSPHEKADINCTNCHYVMSRKSKRKMFVKADSKMVCFQCHRDKRAKILRTSHMPLREGKMDCASCHNPHGGPGPSMMKLATVNETCYMCHQEKRGPVLWEHAPVRENCSNCHDPHGSNFSPMLIRKPPYLCQECHLDGGHVPSLYDGSSIAGNDEKLLGKACLNCHSAIHGSNHPSGFRLLR